MVVNIGLFIHFSNKTMFISKFYVKHLNYYPILIIIFCGLLFSQKSSAQNNNKDTLALVKELANKKETKKAYLILEKYYAHHKNNVEYYTFWQLAQLAFDVYEWKEADKYYLLAISKEPNNKDLLLDYGKFLLNSNQYPKAIKQLTPLQNDLYAKYYLIKAYYWQGNYSKAKQIIYTLSKDEKKNKDIKYLLNDFAYASAGTLNISSQINIDDQPLTLIAPKVSFSKKFSNTLHPTVAVSMLHFSGNDSVKTGYLVNIGNSFQINAIKASLDVTAGMLALNGTNSFTANMLLKKKISNSFSSNIDLGRQPYLYTISSSIHPVLYNHAIFACNIDNLKGVTGKLQYQIEKFDDDNKINDLSFWALSPSLIRRVIDLKLGYAYQNSNADKNTYTTKYSVTTAGDNLAGFYYPYFTPKQLSSHSLLLYIQAKPNNRFTTTLNVSIPLFAELQNPYLYSTVDSNNKVTIYNGFAKQSFHPINAALKASYKFTDLLSATIDYQYLNGNFYSGHFITASVNYILK